MANNVYGIKKQALFNPGLDCEIYYYYKPSRSSVDVSFKGFKKIDKPEAILSNSKLDDSVVNGIKDKTLPGMYDLKLPVSIFGKTGIYTLYIVPKEIKCEICGNTEWLGQPIPLELHHVDRNHYNNDLNNVKIICPNCHALQPGNSGANMKSVRKK